MTNKKLSEFLVGEQGVVSAVDALPELAEQLMEQGIAVGETVTMEGQSPFGDPIVISLMNYHLSIRKSEAEKVILRDVEYMNGKRS
jgi:Fe2+ transport system protein FeoA